MGFNCGLKEPSTQGSFFFLQKKENGSEYKTRKNIIISFTKSILSPTLQQINL